MEFWPFFRNRVMSSEYGGHHTEPTRLSFTYTTAASRTGASNHACMPALRLRDGTGWPSPKSSRTAKSLRSMLSDTLTLFSYVAVPEKYRVSGSSAQECRWYMRFGFTYGAKEICHPLLR